MKKALVGLLIGLLVGAGAVYLLVQGLPTGGKVAGEKTSFAAVTKKLDAGGDFYVYLRTDTIVRMMDKLFGFADEVMSSKAVTGKLPAGTPEFSKWKDVLWKIWEISGFKEIDGIGASSVTLEPQLYHSKAVIHHPAGKGDGLIWSLSRKDPRPLAELQRYFPADTVIAQFTEFQIHDFWKRIRSESEKAGWTEVVQGMSQAEQFLTSQQLDLNKILASFEGRFGFLIHLDSKKTVSLPIPGTSLNIPEPSLALFFKVKDAVLFDLLEKKIPGVQKADKDGIRMLKIAVPPMPIPLEPVVALKDGLLVIASRPQLVEQMFAGKTPRLTGSEDYKRFARYLPSQGTEFSWFSPVFFRTLSGVMKQVGATATPGEEQQIISMMADIFSRPLGSCQVGEHVADGAVWTANSSFSLTDFIDILKMGITSALKEKAAASEAVEDAEATVENQNL